MDGIMIVFTLHKYIFRELFRVFLLATTALTLILSLGSILQPIQKYGVGPEQIVHILGYLLPVILTFALPMAALFASAFIYGRFANDNELSACRASGISMMTLVYPGLLLAIMVSITTLILSFHVVPIFVHRAEKSIKANAKQILFRNVQRKGYWEIPGKKFKIYADKADSKNNILTGAIIVKRDETGISKLIAAEKAKILIDQSDKENVVRVVAQKAYQIDDIGQQESFNELPVSGRFESLLSDSIKFQTNEQIKKIKANMLEYYPIRQDAMAARAQLAIEMLAEDINNKIKTEEEAYYQFVGDDRIVMFTANECVAQAERTIDVLGPIRLVEFDKITHEKYCQWDSAKGVIKLEDPDQVDSEFLMILENPKYDRGGGIVGLTSQHVIKNLPLPEKMASLLSMDRLLGTIEAIPEIMKTPATGDLAFKRKDLKRRIGRTFNEILAETHSRLIFGLGCITLILTSIALGIMLKGGHLLSAFGTSALPFAALVIFMMSGKQLTENPLMNPSVGITVMWSGLLLLSLIALILYKKLLRT